MRRSTILIGLAASLQCGPTQTDEDTSTGTSSTGTETPTSTSVCMGDPASNSTGETTVPETSGLCHEHSTVDSCCCFEAGESRPLCGTHLLCQEIVFSGEGSLETSCQAAIDCALQAFIANKPGTLRWLNRLELGYETRQIHIVGDGTVFTAGTHNEDLGCVILPVERRNLKPMGFFSECAANPSVAARLECILYAFVGDPIEICVEEGSCEAPI